MTLYLATIAVIYAGAIASLLIGDFMSDSYKVSASPQYWRGMTVEGRKRLGEWIARVNASEHKCGSPAPSQSKAQLAFLDLLMGPAATVREDGSIEATDGALTVVRYSREGAALTAETRVAELRELAVRIATLPERPFMSVREAVELCEQSADKAADHAESARLFAGEHPAALLVPPETTEQWEAREIREAVLHAAINEARKACDEAEKDTERAIRYFADVRAMDRKGRKVLATAESEAVDARDTRNAAILALDMALRNEPRPLTAADLSHDVSASAEWRPNSKASKAAVKWVERARSDDETRWNLTGVYLTADGRAVATDGHRLHVAPCDYSGDARYLDGLPQRENCQFPDYTQVIPSEGGASFLVDAAVLARAVKSVGSIAADRRHRTVRLTCEPGGVWLRSFNVDLGESRGWIACEAPAGKRISLNAAFLLDAIHGVKGPVRINIADDLSPIRIDRPDGGIVIVMPLRDDAPRWERPVVASEPAETYAQAA